MKQSILFLISFCFSQFTFAQSTDVIAKIDSIRFSMQQLTINDDFSNFAEYYAPEAIVNGFDGSLNGIEDIRSYWKNIQGKDVDWIWKNIEYSGSEGYVTQTGISMLTQNYGTRDITFTSSFSVIWEKQKNRDYKIISDFYRKHNVQDHGEFTRDSVFIVTKTDTLFGIFFLPESTGNKKVPAILCLQGGGNVGLSNYFYEAKFFAEKGLAVLVCDKSGAGLSRGESSWITQTFDQKSNEYFQLYMWLKNQPDIDADKVGIHGLSEGGRLALDLAIKHPDEIAFVNAVSAPIESFKQNQLFAIYNSLLARNIDFSVIVETLSIWNRYFNEIAEDQISNELIQQANLLRKKIPDLYLPPNSKDLPQRPQSADIHFSLQDLVSKIDCPVLFQYGQEDTRVNTTKSISLIPDKSNFKELNYENTDHSMNLQNGSVNIDYLRDKDDWLQSIGIK